MLGQAIPSSGSRVLSVWTLRVLAATIGAAVWVPAVWLLLAGPSHPSDLGAVLRCLPLVAAAALALGGWDWLSQVRFGTCGNLLKFLALMGIVFTVAGCVWVFYWTGRSVLRLTAGRLL